MYTIVDCTDSTVQAAIDQIKSNNTLDLLDIIHGNGNQEKAEEYFSSTEPPQQK